MDTTLFLAGIVFIIGAACAYFGATFLRRRVKLLQHGDQALAKVIDVSMSTRVVKRQKRNYTEPVYVCTLEFSVHNEWHTVRHVTREATMIGEVKVIAYLPEKPEQYLLAQELSDTPINTIIPAGFAIMGTLLLVMSAVIVFQ